MAAATAMPGVAFSIRSAVTVATRPKRGRAGISRNETAGVPMPWEHDARRSSTQDAAAAAAPCPARLGDDVARVDVLPVDPRHDAKEAPVRRAPGPLCNVAIGSVAERDARTAGAVLLHQRRASRHSSDADARSRATQGGRILDVARAVDGIAAMEEHRFGIGGVVAMPRE